MTTAVAAEDRPRRVRSIPTLSDRAFRGFARAGGAAAMVVMGLIGLFLVVQSVPAWKRAGLDFLTEHRWLPDVGQFGIGAVLPGTALIATVALCVAVPVALSAALYISEYAPRGLRRPLISLIDLMAAVPSIVYGLWGLLFLQPRIIGLSRWIAHHLGFVPFLRVETEDYTSSTFIAGVVVALMVIPIICSLSREVFSQAPQGEREAAYALGANRWGMVRTVVLPFGKGGVIGATMLGMGRALGETIAVALIISPKFTGLGRIIEGGGISISALIALRYPDSGEFALAALMGAGLVLFAITLVVNALASMVVSRSRSGAVTEA